MNVTGVIWLRDVVDKLLWKHRVTTDEVEEVLSHSSRYRFIETGDVAGEDLYAAMGQTEAGRYLIASLCTRQQGRRWLSAQET